jgi:hypothetical protein
MSHQRAPERRSQRIPFKTDHPTGADVPCHQDGEYVWVVVAVWFPIGRLGVLLVVPCTKAHGLKSKYKYLFEIRSRDTGTVKFQSGCFIFESSRAWGTKMGVGLGCNDPVVFSNTTSYIVHRRSRNGEEKSVED